MVSAQDVLWRRNHASCERRLAWRLRAHRVRANPALSPTLARATVDRDVSADGFGGCVDDLPPVADGTLGVTFCDGRILAVTERLDPLNAVCGPIAAFIAIGPRDPVGDVRRDLDTGVARLHFRRSDAVRTRFSDPGLPRAGRYRRRTSTCRCTDPRQAPEKAPVPLVGTYPASPRRSAKGIDERVYVPFDHRVVRRDRWVAEGVVVEIETTVAPVSAAIWSTSLVGNWFSLKIALTPACLIAWTSAAI